MKAAFLATTCFILTHAATLAWADESEAVDAVTRRVGENTAEYAAWHLASNFLWYFGALLAIGLIGKVVLMLRTRSRKPRPDRPV
ncbi:hypothetical protein DBIPINDM_003326 [Mesorhizobium sp. AR02]|uniref:hypothetical protein n=1 Tax=Mesorhizobium sp. AR02 TaxID=2865837 RepID=UPI00215F0557|nr:hypothetical protein [Mesorhizobium sp. AR02]UVK56704.1 hypothetical protein DBIPINDM_003326 [Mesorhizobium sp. AR02]